MDRNGILFVVGAATGEMERDRGSFVGVVSFAVGSFDGEVFDEMLVLAMEIVSTVGF